MEKYDKEGRDKITKEKTDKLQSCIYNHTQVVKLPLENDHINFKYNRTGGFIRTEKLLIQITIIHLQNYLLQPPSEGGFDGAR